MNELQKDINGDLDELEKKMLELPQAEVRTEHIFSEGLYVRELHLSRGVLAMGHFQKFSQWNVFLKGKVQVLNDDYSTTVLEAPMSFEGKPGRKFGLVLEDMVWQNIFPNPDNCQDIAKLEDRFFDKSHHSTSLEQRKLKALAPPTEEREDFFRMIEELGVTPEIVEEQSNIDDLVDLPSGSYKFKLAESPIDRIGVFSTAFISSGEVIGPARIGENRTVLGRYTNHSHKPNAFMKVVNNDILLVAGEDIPGPEGGFSGCEIVIDYRQAVRAAIEAHQRGIDVNL